MISLITSLYKSERFIKKYIRLIIRFNREMIRSKIPWELIIIANDISDFEYDAIKYLDGIVDYKLVAIPREPLYASWNRGVSLSRYQNIGFWNVDDVRFPKAIKKGLSLLEKNNLIYFPFVYKRYVRIWKFKILAKVKIVRPSLFDGNRFQKEMHIGPFFIFSKKFFNEVGPFDESFKIAGDFDWQARAAKLNHFCLASFLAGIFNNDGKSLSGSKNILQKQENGLIYKRYICKE